MIQIPKAPSLEQLPTPGFERILDATTGLISFARNTIHADFGPSSDLPLDYHFLEHTDYVIADSIALGNDALKNGNITVLELHGLLVAAAFHDIIYKRGATGKNEFHSAQYATGKIIDRFEGKRNALSRTVGGLILSTSVDMTTPGRIIQSAEADDYPAMLLCDADLASFGKDFPIFFEQALRVFEEFNWKVTDVRERQQLFLDFFRSNVEILGGQKFYTVEANTRFNQRERNGEKLTKKLMKPSKAFMKNATRKL